MTKWHLLIYKLPSEPSSPRVATWRALKRLDGRYLQDGVYATPVNAFNDIALRRIAQGVRNAGGEAHVLDISAADTDLHLDAPDVGNKKRAR